MKYSVKIVTREFSPSEVAMVAGVSTALQRDWRRRGVIQGRSDGWNKYDLSDVIKMTVMRAFTQSGIALETAEALSGMAVLPVIAALSRWDDTAVFDGDELNQEQMDRIRGGAVRGASEDDQFSFVALPEKDGNPVAARLDNLAKGEQLMGQNKSFHGVTVDHYGLAHHIANTSPLPIIRYEIEVKGDD